MDHIFSFYILDDKIWFRNYQIVYKLKAKHVTEKQLVEIGPRFVLDPIRILDGSFSGELLFNNQNYKSTRMVRRYNNLLILLKDKERIKRKICQIEKQKIYTKETKTSIFEKESKRSS